MRRAGKVAGLFLMYPSYTGQTRVGKNMLAFQISASGKLQCFLTLSMYSLISQLPLKMVLCKLGLNINGLLLPQNKISAFGLELKGLQ